MLEVKTRLRRWGNSLGIVVPLGKTAESNLNEGDEVTALIVKEKSRNVLRETFGTMKFKKSVEEMMKESDKELYNE